MWNLIDNVTWLNIRDGREAMHYWIARKYPRYKNLTGVTIPLVNAYSRSPEIETFWKSPLGMFVKDCLNFWYPVIRLTNDPLNYIRAIYHRKTFSLRLFIFGVSPRKYARIFLVILDDNDDESNNGDNDGGSYDIIEL